MSKSNYEKYKELKTLFDFEYRGFNMGQLMGSEIAGQVYSLERFSVVPSIKNSLKYFDLSSFMNEINSKNIITYTYDRDDYLELCYSYISQLRLKEYKLKIIPKKMGKVTINLVHIYKSLVFFFKLKDLEFKIKINLLSYLITSKNTIDALLKSTIHLPENYYSFNSSDGVETFITLYYKQKGVNTYSFQHGMYFNFLEPIPVDVINFENFVADKMLCWGRYSVDEMRKFGINKSRLILFGNPKYNQINPYSRSNTTFKRCLVSLSRRQYNEGNYKLLKIVQSIKSDIVFDIKLHPSLDITEYKNKVPSDKNVTLLESSELLSDLFLKDYDFIITYNTTAHYEGLVSGHLTFGYGYQNDGAILFEEFNNMDKLEDLLIKYNDENELLIDNRIKKFIKYIFKIEKKIIAPNNLAQRSKIYYFERS